jgi:hypothetical protein
VYDVEEALDVTLVMGGVEAAPLRPGTRELSA